MTLKGEELVGLRAEDYQCGSGTKHELAILKLESKGFTGMGRHDRAPLPFHLPFDWNGTDPDDRNWMFQLHAWRMLDLYLHLMLKEGRESASFKHRIAVVADWICDNVLGKFGTFTWYDMSTGIRASKLALLARTVPALDFDLSSIPGFDRMLAEHFSHLMNPKELNLGNHGLFQMQGLKSLASAFSDHSESGEAEKYAVLNMTKIIKMQMGEHGVHTEHSPDYHFFACRRISLILDSPDWQVQEMKFARQLIFKSEDVKPWLVDVTDRIVPIGDGSQGIVRSAQLPSLKKWQHQAETDYLGAILDGYGVVRSRPDLPVEKSSFLFLSASYHSNAHKHDDCLSFVWQEGGAEILIDPGKYGYQKDNIRNYFISRRAHNTVEFNKLSLSHAKRPPYGSGIKEVTPLSNGVWSIRAEAPCSAEGDVHQRKLLFYPGRKLSVVDLITPVGEDQNDYTLWWHFPPQARLEIEGNTCVVWGLANKRKLLINYTNNANLFKAHICEGEEKPRLQGWISPSYLKYEPVPVLGLSASTSGKFEATTVFEWKDF